MFSVRYNVMNKFEKHLWKYHSQKQMLLLSVIVFKLVFFFRETIKAVAVSRKWRNQFTVLDRSFFFHFCLVAFLCRSVEATRRAERPITSTLFKLWFEFRAPLRLHVLLWRSALTNGFNKNNSLINFGCSCSNWFLVAYFEFFY